jgi:hypothetical protein
VLVQPVCGMTPMNTGQRFGLTVSWVGMANGLLLSNDRWQATVILPPPTAEPRGKRAIAAWVSPRGVPAPLQAVGGWWTEPGAQENAQP